MKPTAIARAVGDVVRSKTMDVAYGFRMNTGFPGDVNRTHPFSIEPTLNNATNPLDVYGNAVVIDSATNSVRKILATDTGVTSIYGIGVRPFPTQQLSGGPNAAFGVAGVNATQPLDVLRSGYFMSKVVGTPAKGAPAFLWIAASSGNHVQGGFEAASGGASTVQLTNVFFNGPAGTDGVGELFIRSQ